MHETPSIAVSVIYAEPEHAFMVELFLPKGATVADAIERSGIRETLPGIDIRDDRLGIFARRVTPETVLHHGDRVEIYRALLIDPKEARRKRARDG